MSVSVTAKPKSGKNYFLYTWPEPIRVYCFNGGAEFVRRKYFPSKKIDILNIALPVLESTNPGTWASPIWEEFYLQYIEDLKSKKYVTFGLDTGTELETLCRQSVWEDIQEESTKIRQKMSGSEYAPRNLRMNAIFQRARDFGVNMVTLQYQKEKWEKDGKGNFQPTGEMVMDGWAQTESAVDVPLDLEGKAKGDKYVSLFTIRPNRFDRTMNLKKLEDLTYEELYSLLIGD
jgi:hypothetical protein